jgi:hypothetical protein
LTPPNRLLRSSPSSLVDSPKPFDLVNCRREERKVWLVTQSEVTWTAWYTDLQDCLKKQPHARRRWKVFGAFIMAALRF